jgi:hypothetical protein
MQGGYADSLDQAAAMPRWLCRQPRPGSSNAKVVMQTT